MSSTQPTQPQPDFAKPPLAVTGGSGTALGSFDGLLAFSPPIAASGAVVLHTVSSENGQVAEATEVRVRFVPQVGAA